MVQFTPQSIDRTRAFLDETLFIVVELFTMGMPLKDTLLGSHAFLNLSIKHFVDRNTRMSEGTGENGIVWPRTPPVLINRGKIHLNTNEAAGDHIHIKSRHPLLHHIRNNK